jgi:hypothetical protein
MEWKFIVVLIIAIPVILFPAAFLWYLNLGGLYTALKEKRLMRQKGIRTDVTVEIGNK